MNFKKQPLKGVEIHGAPQVGTRTVNILMGEHANEFVRGDIMDANAVLQAFDELKGNVDTNHDTLEELVNEIHKNANDIANNSTQIQKLMQHQRLETKRRKTIELKLIMLSVRELTKKQLLVMQQMQQSYLEQHRKRLDLMQQLKLRLIPESLMMILLQAH